MNDHCLIKQDWNKKYDPSYKSYYTITKVNKNGTVNVRINNVIDKYNIRMIKPYTAMS